MQQGDLSHVHVWEGAQHHHFTIPVPVYDTDESQEHQRSAHGQHERWPAQGPGAVVAPMAGRVVKIFAANGARVKKGDSILVLEAMKMEVIYHVFCVKESFVKFMSSLKFWRSFCATSSSLV